MSSTYRPPNFDREISSTGGKNYETRRAATSIGQLLDLYAVHLVFVVIFFIGGILLLDKYGQYALTSPTASYTAWDDLFFATGAVTLALNVGFVIGLIFAWGE